MSKEEQAKEEFQREQEELKSIMHQQQDDNDLRKVEKLEVLDI
mgnify:FL=1